MIVAICGNGRVGKDTAAEHLVAQYGFTRVGLADPFKRFCAEVFAFSHEQLWGNARDTEDTRYLRGRRMEGSDSNTAVEVPVFLTPRYALQTLGTEWGRDCYPDVWIEYGLRIACRIEDGAGYDPRRGCYLQGRTRPEHYYPDARFLDLAVPSNGVVFSDLRFRNEVEAFRRAGAKLVRVYRSGYDGTKLAGVAGHSSEEEQRSLPDALFDAIINNSGSLEEYREQIDAVYSKWRSP